MHKTLDEIHKSGFDMTIPKEYEVEMPSSPMNFNKLKVGTKTLDDATIKVGSYRRVAPKYGDKLEILRAIHQYDLVRMREISDFYYKASGIYARILRYMAFMYLYDWFVTPYVNDKSIKKEKLLQGFGKVLGVLDNFNAKKVLGEMALSVLRYGVYYGYKVETSK